VGKQRLSSEVTKSVMLKAGLKPLEPYISFNAKWKCIHLECGQIVYPRYADIQGGQGGCRSCGFRKGSAKRKNDDSKLIQVMTKAKLQPLEPYKENHAKWKCRCLVCKKIVYPTFNHVKRTNSGCVYCSKRKVDQEEVMAIMRRAKLKPLVPYKGNKTKWKCLCLVCKKTVYPIYNSIQRGSGGCKYCAGMVVTHAQAKKLFISAKLMPLEPYRNSSTKWKSECMVCGEIVYPTYGNIYMGHRGCLNCSDIGFKPKQPALLYIITHTNLNAIKIGITNTSTIINRLDQFKRHGWQIHKKYSFKKGIHASTIEANVIRWLKKELKLRNHLSAKDMPITGGHTETFDADSISVVEIQRRIELLKKGL